MLIFTLWVLLLAALLFWPLAKLVFVLSVRRLQRKLDRELDAKELAGQLNRARVISALASLVFSYLYNLNTIGLPGSG